MKEDHHVLAILDQADIANSDCMDPNALGIRRKRASLNDGFVTDLNVTKYQEKFRCKLSAKTHQ